MRACKALGGSDVMHTVWKILQLPRAGFLLLYDMID